jgi:hypothetical protein
MVVTGSPNARTGTKSSSSVEVKDLIKRPPVPSIMRS